MENEVLVGEAFEQLKKMNDNSVDCCITSPPYYGLRNYGHKYQIGLEKSPDEYINKLVCIFREIRRVLSPDGTLWVNMGDSYASNNKQFEFKRKDLMGIPWKLAFALRDDGWYLRQDIIWHKPNCMPESVQDRCTKSHEYIFLLSKSDKYYFDYEAIKEPAVGFYNAPPAGSKGTLLPNSRRRKGNAKSFRGGVYTNNHAFNNSDSKIRESTGNCENNSGLRNKRDVWSISTQGYTKSHFATFPEKLIEPCILAGCREDGVVIDPFIGSGTTAVVAVKHKRKYIGIEVNPTYAEMAKERINQVVKQIIK